MNVTNFFIPDRDSFFDDLATMFLSLSCFMFTMHVSTASNRPTPFNDRSLEEWISYIAPIKMIRWPFKLACRAGDSDYVIFPAEIVMAVSLNGWPQFIEYELVPHATTRPDYRLNSEGSRAVFSNLVGTSFISYYSKCETSIKDLYGSDPKQWPDTVRMAWLLRNGFAHGGRVSITDTHMRPAEWKKWKIDSTYNGRNCLFDEGMFGIGDVISLVQEIDSLAYQV